MFCSTKQGSCGQLESCHFTQPFLWRNITLALTTGLCGPGGQTSFPPLCLYKATPQDGASATLSLSRFHSDSRSLRGSAQHKHIQGSCQIHGTMLGQAYVSSLPQMLQYFQKQGQASPSLSFSVKIQPNGDRRGPASVFW